MTKLEWQDHIIAATGVYPPGKKGLSFQEEAEEWADAVHNHLREFPNCPECRDRRRTRRKNKESRIRNQMMRDMGMKRTRSGAWEDILKYGTEKEIEFLLEGFTPDPLYNDLRKPQKRIEILTKLGLSPQELAQKQPYDLWKYLTTEVKFADKLRELGYLKQKIDLGLEPGPKPGAYDYLTKRTS